MIKLRKKINYVPPLLSEESGAGGRGSAILLLLLAIALTGCNEAKPTAGAPTTPGTQATAEAKVAPEEVKTEGFKYYGLDNLKPMPIKESGGARKGTVETELLEVKNGEAVYVQTYTGDFETLGSSEVIATKDGIYTRSVNGQVLPKPEMEMPADPKPGFKWTVKTKLTLQGREIENELTDSVVGMENVKVGAKTYNALLLQGSGTMKEVGQPSDIRIKKWLVKDLGAVKMEIHRKPAKGKEQVMTLVIAE